ncbi:HETdomain-containing protein [Colletotrichum kahawae]|uniref:HETdomain-containing protein n=1 Tax=Colletotrichum kahawae TaxID=34407 RepID=A0AAD9YBW4_COLKA|nr:HETdomain-containing protein [Colletotrichum kahawae]
MSTSRILYPPLDRETRSTRLLKFLPRKEEETINCTLTNHTLNDPPPFIGLSYVWGAPEPTAEFLRKAKKQFSFKDARCCRELSKLRRSWQTDSKQPSYTNRDPDFGARPTLTRLLAFCKDYQCSDLRDRVYGLLGLTDVECENRLLADYGISPFQLFHRVMSHLHQQGRVLSQIFRTRLAEGLQILDHEDLPTSTFIYEVVGGRNVKRLLVSDANVCKDQFLKDLVEYLGEDLRGGVESESSQFQRFLSRFQNFPVEEDPATWDLFERAMRKAFELDEDGGKI